ncbi:hypothetical protein BS78_02G016300 [Paspalum vaginatum]|nr:hypothetical protein BS78_02G016300 [Paspalum vaginatum]
MAQIVSTAVVQETVSKVLSNLVQKYEEREESNANRNMERLEMAHIRLKAVLETSGKWQITDTSLLRWRRKLERAAQECDETLHRWKQRILEDEETEKELKTLGKKLLQLPTQNLPWVPYVESQQKERWDNLHSFGTRWFRPNPLCCKQGNLHSTRCSSKADMSEIQDVSLEPVIEVNLQCQVSPSQYDRHMALVSKGRISLQDPPRLKAGLLFMLHGSSEDLLPVNTSCAAEVIHADKQHCLDTNITLQQLEEIILPKAVDYFDQNAEASIYQILWKFKSSTPLAIKAFGVTVFSLTSSHLALLYDLSLKTSPYIKDTCPYDSVKGKGYCTSLNPRMAEIVSSAVVQETVSQVISNLVQKYEEKEESSANRNLERLEMAHIRLEATLGTSEKWQISEASLLRWRRKLKRAAQECDDTVHKCRQRILDDR